ncbi:MULTISPECIES: ATP/GTP-binding protein [unclassified Streptomyces]|uniref:ATP/GTP-binding protein n=1 Tax=unclassified Streptomyces TaxID=2593676 RepID=UPI001F3BF471|nr:MULTISPECIES: ATP/GTP-binding protein [unclassified Streptomyces]
MENHRRRSVRYLLLTGLLGPAVLSPAQASVADVPMNVGCSKQTRFVTCNASGNNRTSGSSGHKGTSQAAGSNKGGGKGPKCTMKKMVPQPPPGSALWKGEGKIVYQQVCPDGPNSALTGPVGVDAGAPAVDPAVVAAQAVDKMELLGPQVASPRAGARYTVGVPVWMWVTPSASTFGPNSASASAGGVTVTAKAEVSKIVWDMGDGEKVTCTGPGTPFKNTRHGVESPDCGHIYQQPSTRKAGAKYRLTATAYWDVTWQATTGEAGQIPTTRQTDVSFTVGELQSVGS